jgi:hypothetical protein
VKRAFHYWKLSQEYGVLKVDALNCVDFLLGVKGKVLEADPGHDLLFLYPGMIDFFTHFKEKAQKENRHRSIQPAF